MEIYGSYPHKRLRRMRFSDVTRDLVRESVLTVNDLIYPVFVLEGHAKKESIASMPGVVRQTADHLMESVSECCALGLSAIAPVSGGQLWCEES